MKRFIFILAALVSTAAAQIIPSTGNVRGPTSATDNAIARFDGTTGKLVQNSGVTIDDSSNLTVGGTGTSTFAGNLTVSGSGGVTASDLTLGTSGPSVKSTLSARAPRQGLVFDGTAIAQNTNVPAFGTADFTFAAWVYQPTLADAYLCSSVGGADDVFMYLTGTGTFQWWSNSVARATSSAGAVQAGKWTLLTATRTGGTTTLYANGVSVGSGADTQNITAAIDRIGGRSNSTNILNGALVPLIYNRALSSSEVVALYEAGAPAGADYNSASNTAINDVTAYQALNTFTTFSGASATGFTGVKASGYAGAILGKTGGFTVEVGQQIRVTGTLTLNNGKTVKPALALANSNGTVGYSASVSLTAAGAFNVLLTCNARSTAAYVLFQETGDQDYTISGVSITRAGLLLAPDAVENGLGYEWHDQSGNGAHIVLPSSGVTWNLPSTSRNYISGTTSTNGNEKLLGASVLLPANSRITSIQARSRSGTPSITIGTASGGAQLVASVALSTTWKNLTVALTDGVVSSADDVWVGSNSTDVVEVRINYESLSF